MKTQDIKNMGLAYKQVLDEALKGGQHKLDKDKDGDIDAKDFAHMRKKKTTENDEVEINPKMKAKKKEDPEMACEKNVQVDEISKGMVGRYLKKVPADAAHAGDRIGTGGMGQVGASPDVKKGYEKQRKKGISQFLKRQKGTNMAVDKLTGKAKVPANEENVSELSKQTLGAYAKAASDDKADHAQDTGKHYANNANYKGAMSSYKRDKRRDGVKMAVNKLMKKEEVETIKWPVYARIMEMRAAHNKGATEPEAMDSKASKGEKDFKAMHKVDMVPADLEKKGHDDASAAGRVTKPAAARNGDNKAGDKSIVNPVAGAKTS